MTGRVLTYLPCTLDNQVYQTLINSKTKWAFSIQYKTKEYENWVRTYIYLKKYLIQIKGKRHMSQENLRSLILSSAYHMATQPNWIWFGFWTLSETLSSGVPFVATSAQCGLGRP